MKTIFLILIAIFSNYSFGQDLFNKRSLRIWNETGNSDTIVYKVEKNDKGEILVLEQSCIEILQDTVFETFESYKKEKRWTLFRYREVLKKKKKKITIYKQIVDGRQYQFDENGNIIYVDDYVLGTRQEPYLGYIYYPNGNLKFIAEVKNDEFWNILTYKFPSGEDHDFGNFQDGEGIINHLDDDGFPCLQCITINKKTRGKILCDEEK